MNLAAAASFGKRCLAFICAVCLVVSVTQAGVLGFFVGGENTISATEHNGRENEENHNINNDDDENGEGGGGLGGGGLGGGWWPGDDDDDDEGGGLGDGGGLGGGWWPDDDDDDEIDGDDENDDDGAEENEPPDAVAITYIYGWNSDPLMIPLGAGDDTIRALIGEYNERGLACRVNLDDGRSFVPVRLAGWDPGLIDVTAEGEYFPLLLDLPEGVFYDGPVEIPVWAMDPDAVSMLFFEDYGSTVWVSWLKEIGEPSLWISPDGADWEQAPGGTFAFRDSPGAYTKLVIFLFELGSLYEDGIYYFHIRWENDGVSTGMLRADYAGGSVTHKPLEGDRTGEGRGEQSRPPVPSEDSLFPRPPANRTAVFPPDETLDLPNLTPLSDPTHMEGEADTADIEYDQLLPPLSSADSIILSGDQIDAMIAANPEYVTLISGDLRVSLPSGGLENLGIDAAAPFSVVLAEAEDGGVDVSLFVNGQRLEWSYDEPYLADRRDASGFAAAPAETPDLAASAPQQSGGPSGLYIFAAGMAGLCAAGTFIWRRRHNRQRRRQ